MDSTVISLLGAFLLSILGMFVFVWSLRKGSLKENPYDLSVIFALGEVGQVDDPALLQGGQKSLQQAVKKGAIETDIADPAELQGRMLLDQSTAFPVLMFISFAGLSPQHARAGPCTAQRCWPAFLRIGCHRRL